MKRSTVIISILLSLIMVNPVMAIKRVPKSNDQSRETQQNGDSIRHESPDKATTPKPSNPEPPKQPERPSQPNKPSIGEKDRFIDEDNDGINDRLKMPPETVKKKRDSKSDHSDKSDKDKKSRR
jgi:hypothetical protein